MDFIESYKHLEKLCGEVFNDDRRVSAYIDEMLNTPRGVLYVPSWNEDLKKLKHYRRVRNQIAHEPGCNEQNMCEPADALWLDDFYSRMINQTDPLSLYRKATASLITPKHKQSSSTSCAETHAMRSKASRKLVVLAAFLSTVLLVLVMIAFAMR